MPEEYGGLGLDYTTFASILRNSAWTDEPQRGHRHHHILTYVLTHYGTGGTEQRFLPDLAAEETGGLALTEPSGGTDVANLQTATKDGEEYIINGSKMSYQRAIRDMFCLLARTDRDWEPRTGG